MNFNSIGTSGLNAADFAALRKQMFERSDTNADGSLSRGELTAALKNSPQPTGANGVKAPSATEVFRSLDLNGDDKVTESELEAGSASQEAKRPSTGAAPAGGPPPGGPPPGGGGGKAKGSDDGASSSKYYDKMDADKDGTVSADEKLAYLLKHPEAAKKAEARRTTSKPPNANGTGLILNTEA